MSSFLFEQTSMNDYLDVSRPPSCHVLLRYRRCPLYAISPLSCVPLINRWDALEHEFFRTAPLPISSWQHPTYPQSHEFKCRQLRMLRRRRVQQPTQHPQPSLLTSDISPPRLLLDAKSTTASSNTQRSSSPLRRLTLSTRSSHRSKPRSSSPLPAYRSGRRYDDDVEPRPSRSDHHRRHRDANDDGDRDRRHSRRRYDDHDRSRHGSRRRSR